MLVNKTEKTVDIKYDERTISVESKKSLDVREFGVANENVLAVEKHILTKNPDVFEQKKTKDLMETNKQYESKIESLEKEIKRLSENVAQANKERDVSGDKLSKVLTENEGYKNKNSSLVKEVAELKAKVKALS